MGNVRHMSIIYIPDPPKRAVHPLLLTELGVALLCISEPPSPSPTVSNPNPNSNPLQHHS